MPISPLAVVVQAIVPGGELLSIRRLRGGIGARMHALRIVRPDSTRLTVVLRRYRPEDEESSSDHATQEFEVLRALARAGIPAPRPLWIDASGKTFGTPALVLSYLPGRSLYPRSATSPWTQGLADALARIHQVPTAGLAPLGLPTVGLDQIRQELAKRQAQVKDGTALEQRVSHALTAQFDSIEWSAPMFTHGDFWPGNTVWNRGRLVAVVDWTSATLADPEYDVAQCRLDLVISHGPAVADDFLLAYETAIGKPLPNLRFFDLFLGLRALHSYEKYWLPGYRDLGLTDLSAELAGSRLERFLNQALDSATTPTPSLT